MLLRKYKNDNNIILYVGDNIVFGTSGEKTFKYSKEKIRELGYEDVTEEGVAYLHKNGDNWNVEVDESICELHLVGAVTVNGHIEMKGTDLTISGDSLMIKNSNPFAPLIGKASKDGKATLDNVKNIICNVVCLQWETPNEYFLFGAYGWNSLSPEYVLENVLRHTTYAEVSLLYTFDHHFSYGPMYDDRTARILKSKYMVTSMSDFLKVSSEIRTKAEYDESEEIYTYREYLTHYDSVLRDFDRAIFRDKTEINLKSVMSFYRAEKAANIFEYYIQMLSKIASRSARYEIYRYLMLALRLPAVYVTDITYENIVEALDREYAERS